MIKKFKLALLSFILLSISSCCCWRREYRACDNCVEEPCTDCGKEIVVSEQPKRLRGYKTTKKKPINTYQSDLY